MPSSPSLRLQALPWVPNDKHPWLARFTLTLATALLVSPFSCAQEASPSTIRGVVLSSVTREPVARALVTSQDDRFAALTDDQGNFSFNLPPTMASVSATFHAGKSGFLDDEGSNAGMSISRGASAELLFTLTPESLIVGRVNLPSAGSFDRISVELYRREVADGRARWSMAATERTRANGSFRFSGLRAGTYKIFTGELLDRDPLTSSNDPNSQQFGYQPAYFLNAADFGSAAPINLAAGQTFEAELAPTLHPYYPVQIALPTVQPGTGIGVTVFPSNQNGPGFSLGFNSQTLAIEGLLPSGTYTVEAISYGPSPSSGLLTFTVHDRPLLTPTLVLAPCPGVSVNVKEEFSSPDTTSGTGVSGTGRPGPPRLSRRQFSSLQLRSIPADDFSSHPVATPVPASDEDLSGRIAAVTPGSYWLRTYRQRGYVASATSAGVDLLTNPLVVGPGGSAPIDITLRDDTAEIDGTIEDSAPNKNPRTSASAVYCIPLPDSAGEFQQANLQINADTDIAFHCPNLAPGSYRVLAFERSQRELEYHNPEAMRPYESKGPVIRIAGGEKQSVRIPLNP
jgi:hypothetical protein